MKQIQILLFALLISSSACTEKLSEKEILIQNTFEVAELQYNYLISKLPDSETPLFPRGLHQDNSLNLVVKEDWTSGFFPGALWYMYEYNNKESWKESAIQFTEMLDSTQYIKWNHDIGFMVQNSYGNAYRLTNNENYKQVVIQAAKSLSTRYRKEAKIIQSWDTTPNMGWIATRGWDMPVIIDNMMNLHLLYRAYDYTKDTTFLSIANNHAFTTIKNHFREDYSTYHVVDYDHKTGDVLGRCTAQGLYDHSSWARGQAWGLYGYTEAYRETKEPRFLKQAIHIANYIIDNPKIPANAIPYWDYDDPKIPNSPKDASAAAITASALLDLMSFDTSNAVKYSKYASQILNKLCSKEYLAEPETNGGFILKHSVGNIHTGEENDRPLNYADYYFLEALVKWNKI